jgi:hypothetical protein
MRTPAKLRHRLVLALRNDLENRFCTGRPRTSRQYLHPLTNIWSQTTVQIETEAGGTLYRGGWRRRQRRGRESSLRVRLGSPSPPRCRRNGQTRRSQRFVRLLKLERFTNANATGLCPDLIIIRLTLKARTQGHKIGSRTINSLPLSTPSLRASTVPS